MADSSAVEANQTFAGFELVGLFHGVVVLDLNLSPGLGDDSRLLNFGDTGRRSGLGRGTR